jgi:hypothetical protein
MPEEDTCNRPEAERAEVFRVRVDNPLTLRNWLDARGVLATAEKRWPERRAIEIREAMMN